MLKIGLTQEKVSYLEGAAAGLSVVALRDPSIFEKLPILTTSLSPEYAQILEDAVKYVSMS